MLCPFCGDEVTRVLESRLSGEKTSIRRRRECENCSKRFTTYERFENCSVMVVKKDGSKEKFVKDKIIKSISKACKKTNVSVHMIEKIAESIESDISMTGKKEITSCIIGEKIIHHLKDVNEIAYFRYLSIFKGYQHLDEILDEMQVSPKMPSICAQQPFCELAIRNHH